jgi:hypothetical protein
MPIGNNIGEKVKFLSFAKIVQMSAEHQARLSVMPSAALSYAKIINFFVPFFFSEERNRKTPALSSESLFCSFLLQ